MQSRGSSHAESPTRAIIHFFKSGLCPNPWCKIEFDKEVCAQIPSVKPTGAKRRSQLKSLNTGIKLERE